MTSFDKKKKKDTEFGFVLLFEIKGENSHDNTVHEIETHQCIKSFIPGFVNKNIVESWFGC